MDSGMKFILALLVLTTLASIGVGTRFFLLEEATYRKYIDTEQRLTEKNFILKDRLEAIEISNADLEKQLRILAEKLEQAIQMQATLNREYQASRVKMDKGMNVLAVEKAGLKEKIKEIRSEGFLAETLEEKTALEVELKTLKDTLVGQVKGLRDKLVNQETRIKKLASEKAGLEQTLRKLKGARQMNKQVLREVREASDLLSKRLARESQNSLRLAEGLKKIRKSNAALQQQLTRALNETESFSLDKEGIELSPITVEAASPSAAIRGGLATVKTKSFPEGRVLTINNKYKFVIINLGQEDGVRPGMAFKVYRGTEDIGRIEVLEVHPGIAAADITVVKKGAGLRVDDIVKSEID